MGAKDVKPTRSELIELKKKIKLSQKELDFFSKADNFSFKSCF